MTFAVRKRVFEFTFHHDSSVAGYSEFTIPDNQYPSRDRVEVPDGSYHASPEEQTLVYQHCDEQVIRTLH